MSSSLTTKQVHPMTTIRLTAAQHPIPAYAVHNTDRKISWFPDAVKDGTRKRYQRRHT